MLHIELPKLHPDAAPTAHEVTFPMGAHAVFVVLLVPCQLSTFIIDRMWHAEVLTEVRHGSIAGAQHGCICHVHTFKSTVRSKHASGRSKRHNIDDERFKHNECTVPSRAGQLMPCEQCSHRNDRARQHVFDHDATGSSTDTTVLVIVVRAIVSPSSLSHLHTITIDRPTFGPVMSANVLQSPSAPCLGVGSLSPVRRLMRLLTASSSYVDECVLTNIGCLFVRGLMMHPEGSEPPTYCLEDNCSSN